MCADVHLNWSDKSSWRSVWCQFDFDVAFWEMGKLLRLDQFIEWKWHIIEAVIASILLFL